MLINTYSTMKLIKGFEKRDRSHVSLRSTMVHPWGTMQYPTAKKQCLVKHKGRVFWYSKDHSFYSVFPSPQREKERKRHHLMKKIIMECSF